MKYYIYALFTDGVRERVAVKSADNQHDEILMRESLASMAQRGVWTTVQANTRDLSELPVFYPAHSIVRFEIHKRNEPWVEPA